jgi:hypothetical protein
VGRVFVGTDPRMKFEGLALFVQGLTVDPSRQEQQMPLGTLEWMRTDHDPGGTVRRALATDVKGQALFGGPRREFRYFLSRAWDVGLPAAMFVMMNPSVADIDADDPTVARCQTFARSWGCGGLYVVNTFAYRATDQGRLLAADDPVGPENDRHILATAELSKIIVMAYGQPHKSLRQRGVDVCTMLKRHGHRLHALKLNADGTPGHPLYLSGALKPFPI